MTNEQGFARAFSGSDALHRSPGVVLNEQGLLGRLPGSDVSQWCPIAAKIRQGRVQKEIRKAKNKCDNKKYKLRLATWNVGTLTGKSVELVKLMRDRRINIVYLQEIT